MSGAPPSADSGASGATETGGAGGSAPASFDPLRVCEGERAEFERCAASALRSFLGAAAGWERRDGAGAARAGLDGSGGAAGTPGNCDLSADALRVCLAAAAAAAAAGAAGATGQERQHEVPDGR